MVLLDEAPLNILKETKYNPAKIKNQVVESDINILVNFLLNKSNDKPEYEFDEISHERYAYLPYPRTIINLNKDGSAYLSEYSGAREGGSTGRINQALYTKLSDFILSQCFFNFKEIYYHSISDVPKTTITLKFNNEVKTTASFVDEFTAIGFWAIKNLIVHIKNQIKREITRSESTIKRLPKRNENDE